MSAIRAAAVRGALSAHSRDDVINQTRPVVHRSHLHVGWQRFPYFVQSIFQSMCDRITIFAEQHEAKAKHYLTLSVRRHGAASQLMANQYVSHVADVQRNSILGRDHDIFDLLHGRGTGDPLYQQHFAGLVFVDVAAADVKIVLAYRVDDFVERDLVTQQAQRIDADLILLLQTAPRVDLGDAAHAAHLGFYDPVVQRAQLLQISLATCQRIVKDLAKSRRHRTHCWSLDALGHLDLRDTLIDLLPRSIDVRAVSKRCNHTRQAELRDRSNLLQAPDTADRQLHWKRDQSLDFLGH